MLLMWEWIEKNGPELRALVSWKNQIVGGLAVIIALGAVQTVMSAIVLFEGK